MIIKYRIKVESDGLTITQQIDSGSQTPPVKPHAGLEQNELGASYENSQAASANTSSTQHEGGGNGGDNPRSGGGNGGDSPRSGGSGLDGSGPITIIGPIILTYLPPSAISFDSEELGDDQ